MKLLAGEVTTTEIIAALNGDSDALTKVRGPGSGSWARTVEGMAAAARLAELTTEIEKLRAEVGHVMAREARRRAHAANWMKGQRVRIRRLEHNAVNEAEYVESLKAQLHFVRTGQLPTPSGDPVPGVPPWQAGHLLEVVDL